MYIGAADFFGGGTFVVISSFFSVSYQSTGNAAGFGRKDRLWNTDYALKLKVFADISISGTERNAE